MSKQFKLDFNEAAFLHVLYSAFAGNGLAIDMAKQKKEISKKEALRLLAEVNNEACVGLASEYIRGELIRKGVLENDPTLFCSFDPSADNKDLMVEVFTKEEVEARQNQFVNNVKGR